MYFAYILANRKYGTLYIGVTSNLVKRIYEHKNSVVPGFTNDHDVKKLVYYDILETASAAIAREKQLKYWQRQWKIDLIEIKNPNWDDLYEQII